MISTPEDSYTGDDVAVSDGLDATEAELQLSAEAVAAAARCEQRVRSLMGDYVPVPAYANALTSLIMSYAQEYAHTLVRLYAEAATRRRPRRDSLRGVPGTGRGTRTRR